MNPTLPQSVIDRAYDRDAASASAEYGACFRTDLEQIFPLERVAACTSFGCYARGPVPGTAYKAFVDPSGGSSDSFTLCIGHGDYQDQIVVVDLISERVPPFSPEGVVADHAKLLRMYSITNIIGDRYAGLWPVEAYGRVGVTYEQSARPKSDLYRDLLPVVNSGNLDLLDVPRLRQQLTPRAENRARREGLHRPSPNQHDDMANAVAGVVSLVNVFNSFDQSWSWVDGEPIGGTTVNLV